MYSIYFSLTLLLACTSLWTMNKDLYAVLHIDPSSKKMTSPGYNQGLETRYLHIRSQIHAGDSMVAPEDVEEAYGILKDPLLRKTYDAHGYMLARTIWLNTNPSAVLLYSSDEQWSDTFPRSLNSDMLSLKEMTDGRGNLRGSLQQAKNLLTDFFKQHHALLALARNPEYQGITEYPNLGCLATVEETLTTLLHTCFATLHATLFTNIGKTDFALLQFLHQEIRKQPVSDTFISALDSALQEMCSKIGRFYFMGTFLRHMNKATITKIEKILRKRPSFEFFFKTLPPDERLEVKKKIINHLESYQHPTTLEAGRIHQCKTRLEEWQQFHCNQEFYTQFFTYMIRLQNLLRSPQT